MSCDAVIKIEELSKCFQIYSEPRDRLKQSVLPRVSRAIGREGGIYFREFWALKNINFNVAKGETVGIVGRNGSGKSTLLQIICGTLAATAGSAMTKGRIAALLELGSGFNPEFTGRENVYMNAALLGLSRKEIDERFDEIAEFADIGEFIERPVKTYSSGMMVRLAFAVQAQVEPDILIVDEALAVGDVRFQAKCFERLRQLKACGTSILLVTHSTEQIVTHCDKALLLEQGQVAQVGAPKDVVNTYMDILFAGERKLKSKVSSNSKAKRDAAMPMSEVSIDRQEDIFSTRAGYNPHEYRWGDGAAQILDYLLLANGAAYPTSLATGQHIELIISVRFEEALIMPILGVTIKTKEGVTVYGVNSETLQLTTLRNKGSAGEAVVIHTSFKCLLAPGDYFISLGVATKNGDDVVPHDRRYDAIHLHVRPNSEFFGLIDLDMNMKIEGTS